MISMIAAITKNNAIGKGNELLYKIPADMLFFKAIIKNKPLIVGRKTYESILSYAPNFKEKCYIVKNGFGPDEALNKAKTENPGKEIIIIGGQQVYEYFLPLADKLYITEIYEKTENATAFFPKINGFKKTIISEGYHDNLFFEFQLYNRVQYK